MNMFELNRDEMIVRLCGLEILLASMNRAEPSESFGQTSGSCCGENQNILLSVADTLMPLTR